MDTIANLFTAPPFSSLSKEKLASVIKLAIRKKYAKGEFVTHMEDIWPYLFWVSSGEFNAVKESGMGRSFIGEAFNPGDVFWGLALFENDRPNPMAIRAASDGELNLWPKERISEIIAEDPQFSWGLFSLLAEKIERAGEIVEELVFMPLPGRLANLLLKQSDGDENAFIARDLTLNDMAARIGSTPEMVCKLLSQFSTKGIIDIQRTEFKINDLDELQAIAEKLK